MIPSGTHDVQTIEIFQLNNEVQLNSTFVHGSAAQGVLYALMYLEDNKVNFMKSRYLLMWKDYSLFGITEGVIPGYYRILAFDIEQNYQLLEGFSAVTEEKYLLGSRRGL